jgi:hypothetical protein
MGMESLSLNEKIMEEEEKHKSSSRSSEGGKTPLFGAKTKGKNFPPTAHLDSFRQTSELSMKDILEDVRGSESG